jgi:hypothetical protein
VFNDAIRSGRLLFYPSTVRIVEQDGVRVHHLDRMTRVVARPTRACTR